MDHWITALMTDLFVPGVGFVDKVLRTVLVYLGVLIIVRVAGKRLLAQMNSMDLVVVLLLSNVVQNAIIGPDNSLLGGIVGAVVLVLFNSLVERSARRWRPLRHIIEGPSSTVIRDGAVDDRALARLGLTRGELSTALRRQGADTVQEVELAQIEPGGSITVDLRPEEQSVSRADLDRATAQLRQQIAALHDSVLALSAAGETGERDKTGMSGGRQGSRVSRQELES
ncbi:DUF421 domain-containing protein [Devriesea agamarum]|uniref:DUF421 domain-containing protein n=1 Tax=Devriesea agamarum TaxID=472569 RepID=UPI000A77CBE8|nr:YetF domain-containing protein [Devriesea agamarum]